MSNLNKVFLIGRFGADPELRYTADGTPVTTFNMATSESYKDKSGQKQEKTEWHSIVAWRKLAEITSEYARKGRLVFVEGKIQSREYTDRDGKKRKIFEIVASEVKMMPDGKKYDQSSKDPGQSGQAAAGTTASQGNNRKGTGFDDDFVPELEDDIPI